MKTILIIIGAIVVLISSVYFLNRSLLQDDSTNEPLASGDGRVIFEVTDLTAALQNLSSIKVTIESADIHHSLQGWTNLTDEPQEFDLLALKQGGQKALLADIQAPVGNYDQLRLMISRVAVTEARTGRTVDAKLPAHEFTANSEIVVSEGVSGVVLDFLADQSLHTVSGGEYIYAPVIKMEGRRDVEVRTVESPDNTLEVTKGTVYMEETYGMNESGRVDIGLGINVDEEMEIINGAILVKNPGPGTTVSAEQAISLATIKEGLGTVTSIRMTMFNSRPAWFITGTKQSNITNIYIDSATGAVLQE